MLSPLFRRTTNDRVVSQRGETLGSGRTVWRRVVHPTTVGVYFNEVGCEEGWLTVWGTRAVTTQVPAATKSRHCANQNIYLCEPDQLRSNKSRKTASKWAGEQSLGVGKTVKVAVVVSDRRHVALREGDHVWPSFRAAGSEVVQLNASCSSIGRLRRRPTLPRLYVIQKRKTRLAVSSISKTKHNAHRPCRDAFSTTMSC